jgi:3-phenylpropionate/trans-cinnamate dioxygenase ferredoxin reductase component
MSEKLLIIGGGQAGAQAATSLRKAKFDGKIAILGDEEVLPYLRPPLSKEYLKGELDTERLFLRPREFYHSQNIDLNLGESVTEIDRDKRIVRTGSGGIFSYTKMLLATGAPPRRLSCAGSDLAEIYYLRSLADSDALRTILTAKGRVIIVGAGYIGLEVAAVARAAGRDVTVVEMADRVLARVTSEPVSEYYEKLHRSAGVEILLGAAVEEFIGGTSINAVKLTNGEILDCVAALVGIGAVPDTSLATVAGLEVSNGIVVDDHARTNDPNIWAAGDCTSFPSPRYRRRIRLESVPNAIDQAKAAAVNMAGGDVIYDALPWFWSDQYDVKLQTAGLSEGHDELIIRGKPDDNKFSVWYMKDGAPLAVDAINDPKSFLTAKKLITANAVVDKAKLGDTNIDLKSLLL